MTSSRPRRDIHELTEFETLIGLLASKNWEDHDYFASYGGIVAEIAEKGRKMMKDPEIQAAYKHDHAVEMLENNCSIQEIVEETWLTIEEINELKKEIN